MSKERFNLRVQGDAVAVDTSYMRQVYVATPMKNYPLTPYERAEAYGRALERQGYVRDPDSVVQP